MEVDTNVQTETETEKNTENNYTHTTSSLLLFMVCHDDSSFITASKYANKFSWIKPVLIPNTKYMESIIFHLLKDKSEEWQTKTHIGIIKYSFEEKTPFYNFPYLCETYKHIDVFTFVNGHEDNYQLPSHSMITYAGVCHTLFPVIWHLLLKQFQIPIEQMFSIDIPAFYSNFWIAKKEFFETYLLFYNEALLFMETHEELKTLLHYNANYLQRLPSERLFEIMNVPYYTYHCFISERLPCFFFWGKGASIMQVGGKERVDKHKVSIDSVIPLLSVT